MIGDLLKLYETVQKANDQISKSKAQKQLDVKVEEEIRKLFQTDSRWPKGQRGFKAISDAVGIYDERPQELRQFLFNIGARRKTGSDGKEYWKLDLSSEANENQSLPSNTYKLSLNAIAALTAVVVGVITVLEYFGITGIGLMEVFYEERTIRDIFGE